MQQPTTRLGDQQTPSAGWHKICTTSAHHSFPHNMSANITKGSVWNLKLSVEVDQEVYALGKFTTAEIVAS